MGQNHLDLELEKNRNWKCVKVRAQVEPKVIRLISVQKNGIILPYGSRNLST